MAVCAFLGLGVMGYPMAGHLKADGHDVRVWNRSDAARDRWMDEHGSGAFAEAADAVAGADYVMICVGADTDVFDVVETILPNLKRGMTVIDHTTASPNCARTVAAQLEAIGVAFLDAPISGGQSGAEAGTLSVMCGGAERDFAAAEPVMRAYGKTITHLGAVAAGQTAKCVNQICIAGTLQGLSEGLRFAQAAGLDAETLLKAIGGGAAQSWQMDNRLLSMARDEFDFGFAIDWMRKDLAIALSEARSMELDLPITQQVDAAYAKVQAMGGSRQDTSALIRSLPKVDKKT
ncbi:NAD(P)-dependent oxidoreductase [Algimonas porphyrae]|uniref:3-hydroxyisobutyrate dehydrogenase n=2 Tax=Algimonas porphyrae TaxID=1128113 RepID=A0ABQ5UV42_9PROT|nr:NAD(P)-dependent oxidoreductase [Algimonas porphyrae]GLQ19140.1 3-hydroxyisobutyrate dehydrogenase [Algimonas porphyrae]